MKSFRLHTGAEGELIQEIVGLLVALGLFLALHYFGIAGSVWRIVAILFVAVFVGHLCRGRLCRGLRRQYPNARWIGLLAVGFSIITFGFIARFVVPGTDDRTFALTFLLPAGACIATFVIVNRRDPDVIR